jgi:hypothetical protein
MGGRYQKRDGLSRIIRTEGFTAVSTPEKSTTKYGNISPIHSSASLEITRAKEKAVTQEGGH